MKKLVSIFFIFLISNATYAKVFEANNFDLLSKIIFSEADNGSLVLFDVDNVLIMPTKDFDFRNKIRVSLKKELDKKYSKQEIRKIFSDFWIKREVKLVNNRIPKLIEKLKSKKIYTSALSAWWTNKFGNIEKMESLRLKELNQVGISFTELSPFKNNVVFNNLKNNKGGTPMIISGIILTALDNKGKILDLSLQTLSYKFNKIIFIDDNLNYVKEVEDFCKRKSIDFIGIHYTEAKRLPIPLLDFEKEKTRFNVLEKTHIYMLDKDL